MFFYLSIIVWLCHSMVSFRYSNYVVAFSSIIVIMNICKKMEGEHIRINTILIKLGQSTLFIYLFHYFALQLMVTNYFEDFLIKYSNFGIDLLMTIIPTIFAIYFSLGIKFVVQKEHLVNKWIFGCRNM